MAITALYERTNVTVGATEYSIAGDTTGSPPAVAITTDGVYQLWIDDQTNMTKTEEYRIKIKETCRASGTQRLIFSATIKGVQSEMFCTPMLILMNGWDMTIQKIAGTDRAFDASIRQIS